MNKSGYLMLGIALIAVGTGAYWLGRSRSQTATAHEASQGQRKVLFYRNPMNPAVTSPVPAKDEMGMDYVPVYADASASGKRNVLFYRNPMNPSVTSPVPAKDEMGMDYVPVYADESGNGDTPGTVSIDPTIVQDIGVRTAVAERRALSRKIRTVGRVDYDERGLVRVHLRSDGWIEHVTVADTGQPVRKGQPLLAIYAPQIVAAEQEYRLALSGVATLDARAPAEIAHQARALRDSSAERLRLLGVPDAEIIRLAQGGEVRRQITLPAPASGVVQFVGAREGQYVSAQTEVYRIADLSTVWVLADLYEDEVPWVRPGDPATVQLRGLPGRQLSAPVDYIYPYLDGKTRTQKLRLRLPNPDGDIKPQMYANVTVDAARQIDALTVPESAIVRSGTRTQVFVVRAPGKFEPRTVETGVAADGRVQILEGISAGERVVVSSQFLIDSESRLREAAAKMLPPSESSGAKPAMKMDNAGDTGAGAEGMPSADGAASMKMPTQPAPDGHASAVGAQP